MCVCAANVSNLVIQLVAHTYICVNSFATMSAPSSGRQRLQRQVSESILNGLTMQTQVAISETNAISETLTQVSVHKLHDADDAISETNAYTSAFTDAESMDTEQSIDTEPDSCDATICDFDSDSDRDSDSSVAAHQRPYVCLQRCDIL